MPTDSIERPPDSIKNKEEEMNCLEGCKSIDQCSHMNFLNETIVFLDKYGHEPKDVKWIGCKGGKITWDEFKVIADFFYDNGYVGYVIELTLKVVGEDWWLERHEYDGSEWWEYKKHPKDLPSIEDKITFKWLIDDYYIYIRSIQYPKECQKE